MASAATAAAGLAAAAGIGWGQGTSSDNPQPPFWMPPSWTEGLQDVEERWMRVSEAHISVEVTRSLQLIHGLEVKGAYPFDASTSTWSRSSLARVWVEGKGSAFCQACSKNRGLEAEPWWITRVSSSGPDCFESICLPVLVHTALVDLTPLHPQLQHELWYKHHEIDRSCLYGPPTVGGVRFTSYE